MSKLTWQTVSLSKFVVRDEHFVLTTERFFHLQEYTASL